MKAARERRSRLADEFTIERLPNRRRWIPRWCGFWLSGPLLAASVLIEGICSTAAAIHFFFTRKRQRERFKAMLQGRRFAALVLVLSVVALQVGCTNFPGASFGDQIDQLSWSAQALASDNGEPVDALLDFKSIFIGNGDDLTLQPLAESFSQLGW